MLYPKELKSHQRRTEKGKNKYKLADQIKLGKDLQGWKVSTYTIKELLCL